MIPLFVCLFFGVWVCVTGPAFDDMRERRKLRLDFAKARMLTAGACPVCGRPSCVIR